MMTIEEKKNSEKLHKEKNDPFQSHENFKEYIRIGSAGGYILITALILVTVALIIWGFVGKLPVTITEYGVVGGDQSGTNVCLCFVDVEKNTGVIPVGNRVNIHMADGSSFTGVVTYSSQDPQSADTLKKQYGTIGGIEIFSEWSLNHLLQDSLYNYALTIETDEDISAYWRQVVDVTIIIREVQPITLLMR